MMTKSITSKKNLLLCFDAFDTLFTPRVPIATGYARAAVQHGIKCGDPEKAHEVGVRFREAFKDESKQNPNYGKATGLGAEKWWGNVSTESWTFSHGSPAFARAFFKCELFSIYTNCLDLSLLTYSR